MQIAMNYNIFFSFIMIKNVSFDSPGYFSCTIQATDTYFVSLNKIRKTPEKMKPHDHQIMSTFKMRPLSQEATATLSPQEQVLFCTDADKPCKDTEVTVFTLVQSQIAFFFLSFFHQLRFTDAVRAMAPLQTPNVSVRLQPV